MATKKDQARRAARCVAGAVEDGTGAAWSRLSKYERRARAFLAATGVKMTARYLGDFEKCAEWGEDNAGRVGAVDGRGECVPVFRVRFDNGRGGRFVVRFRSSVNDWRKGREKIGAYDVLSCVQHGDVGAFDDFASEFGYFPIKSRAEYKRARRMWRACLREWAGVCRVWDDWRMISRLAEIV